MLHSLLFLPKNNIKRIKQVAQRKPWERLFEKVVNGQMSQTNFAKNFVIDIWPRFKYTSAIVLLIKNLNAKGVDILHRNEVLASFELT